MSGERRARFAVNGGPVNGIERGANSTLRVCLDSALAARQTQKLFVGRRFAPLVIAILGASLPCAAQFAGPAILSRGEAPNAARTPNLSFRPNLGVAALYDTGLQAVSINDRGDFAFGSSVGVDLRGGVSGSHSWRRGSIGLSYAGALTHYFKDSYYDSTTQSVSLGIEQSIRRHTVFRLREAVGMFSRDFGLRGLESGVPFDPAASYIPQSDFFDNRTFYNSTQADLVMQKSLRLSFDIGGDYFNVRRRSDALESTSGVAARGDFQYRLSRRSTVGALYNFAEYHFTRTDGDTDVHSAAGVYSLAISRRVEFSGFAGLQRTESRFIQKARVDPVIAALLGLSETRQVIHRISHDPYLSGRLSRSFNHGSYYISGFYGVTPGNGVFATSSSARVMAGIGYNTRRSWTFSGTVSYNHSQSLGLYEGYYTDTGGSFSVARRLFRSVHMNSSYSVRRYSSASYANYNRLMHQVRIGIAFAPGDLPLRLW